MFYFWLHYQTYNILPKSNHGVSQQINNILQNPDSKQNRLFTKLNSISLYVYAFYLLFVTSRSHELPHTDPIITSSHQHTEQGKMGKGDKLPSVNPCILSEQENISQMLPSRLPTDGLLGRTESHDHFWLQWCLGKSDKWETSSMTHLDMWVKADSILRQGTWPFWPKCRFA